VAAAVVEAVEHLAKPGGAFTAGNAPAAALVRVELDGAEGELDDAGLVVNDDDAAGAELTLAFKDGVPNYQVSAKGDTLEIVLASAGSLTDATKQATPATRHHKKKH